jgi:Tetratricopeptide repeat
LDACRVTLGNQHPDTLTSMYFLATTYNRHQQPDEALAVGQECLDGSRHVLGAQHPHTLAAQKLVEEIESEMRGLGNIESGKHQDSLLTAAENSELNQGPGEPDGSAANIPSSVANSSMSAEAAAAGAGESRVTARQPRKREAGDIITQRNKRRRKTMSISK